MPKTHSKHTHIHLTKQEMIRGEKLCRRKIETLWRKNMRVEALMYMSLLIEHFLKESIFEFEQILEGSAISMHVAFNPRRLYSRDDLENQPLGYLIKVLEAYTVDNNLIMDLRRFSKVRNECIHKLFGQKISIVNRKLTGFDKFFYELVVRLVQLLLSQIEHKKKHFNWICDPCFQEVRKQVKL
ncbi:MAG: hypothetical protein C0417_04115 [Chlorobiaceae bacterium]|nr:hypothetical protein [Chlorobiaceae bacterium]